ncbi:YhcB family protein [Billgrantia sp. LNSP4103-1]|uniref:YhcB family protein n=1 Tax=Billgrantia sp. LNSP4103-1 TaxID=3410266 RepID=UPI00403F7B6B
MDYGNVNWIVAIVSLLVGLGIGAIGYRMFGTSATRTQELRRQAAEREHELKVLREGMNDHFSQVGMMVSNIQREMRTLEHRLTEDASTLHCEPLNDRKLEAADQPTLTGTDDTLPAPRDYADGSGGTLSEDFGLKSRSDKSDQPQPPRY